MADVFVPGVKSRFDTDKMISGLMEIERVPRNRAQKEVDTLKEQKEHWQILGRRITEMRDSARHLFSFQNPFNERSALSSDDYVLSAESSRESMDSSHNFTVKQLASADKFVSNPLPANYTVPAGTYGFSTGKNDIRFKFSGGGIQEFADVLNKRGEGKVAASLIAIKPNTKSFIIESLDTGAENHLTFSDDAEKFAISTGILAAQSAGPKLINIAAVPAGAQPPEGAALAVRQSASGGGLSVPAMAEVRVALEDGIVPTDTMLLRFETQVSDNEAALAADRAYALRLAAYNEEKAAREAARADGAAIADAAVAGESAAENTPGEADPGEAAGGAYASDVKDVAVTKIAGSDAAEGEGGAAESAGAVAEEGAAVGGAADTFPEIEPPPPHVDNLNALVLLFSDGTSAQLHPVKPSGKWDMQSYQLAQVAAGRTAAAIVIKNENTHRDIAIKDIQLFDPVGEVVTEPRAPISRAQDAIIDMDGIEIERPVNKIDDLIPGMTINARAVSDVPVSVGVQTDTEAVKDGVISLVGNYNKLMVELNVLTRSDDSIVRELNYLSRDEQDALRKRLGVFAGDTALLRFKTALQDVIGAPYRGSNGDPILLNSFGISTDARRGGSYDPTKMRGYLEIDEKALDESLRTRLSQLREVFGLDTDGDKIIDTGLAYELDRAARPYVELGGIIAMRSGNLDSRITANERRIEGMDKKLDAKETQLRTQYGKIEGAYTRMERLSNSLEQFGKQGGGGGR